MDHAVLGVGEHLTLVDGHPQRIEKIAGDVDANEAVGPGHEAADFAVVEVLDDDRVALAELVGVEAGVLDFARVVEIGDHEAGRELIHPAGRGPRLGADVVPVPPFFGRLGATEAALAASHAVPVGAAAAEAVDAVLVRGAVTIVSAAHQVVVVSGEARIEDGPHHTQDDRFLDAALTRADAHITESPAAGARRRGGDGGFQGEQEGSHDAA